MRNPKRPDPPKPLKVLFLAESPPKSRKFFFKGNSTLFAATHEVFLDIFKNMPKEPDRFLEVFQAKKCFLDDICHKPGKPSRTILRKNIKHAANRMRKMSPKALIIVGKGIVPYALEARDSADLMGIPTYWTYFPLRQFRVEYKNKLKRILKDLFKRGILKK